MKQFKSFIISNELIAESFYRLTFTWPQATSQPLPGQFLTIRIADSSVPLLRRPFAFSGCDSKKNTASIVYQKRGVATDILSGRSSNETLDIIGPLGTVFKFDDAAKHHICIAGGMGLGPILFWADWLHAQNKDAYLIAGFSDAAHVPLSLESLQHKNTLICTDDGSNGFHGTVVDCVQSLPPSIIATAAFYACGPHGMLKACHTFTQEKSRTCQVSMEQIMACGVGACMGCVIKVHREPGFARVCREGAVFDSREIIWS